jgi:hypothetical protein
MPKQRMAEQRKKRPRDPIVLAKLMAGQTHEDEPDARNQAAVELGRLGGKKGGKARFEKMSKEERREFARRAGQMRWTAKIKP